MEHNIEKLLENEKEWRRYMLKKVDRIDSGLNALKVKVGVISATIGMASGLVSSYVLKKLGL